MQSNTHMLKELNKLTQKYLIKIHFFLYSRYYCYMEYFRFKKMLVQGNGIDCTTPIYNNKLRQEFSL